MRLTTFSDYTLRTLIYLGLRPNALCTIDEIAEAYAISANHLMKVVQQAAQAHEVQTVRGQGGGIRLVRAPEAINIGTVLRRTEPDLHIAPCFASDTACCIQPACVLQGALGGALAAFMAVLEGYAEHVMDAVGADLLSDLDAMRGALERRRKEKSGFLRLFERLIGMDLKLRQYEQGKRFCDAVAKAGGIGTLNRVWEGPEQMPTLPELDDPEGWIVRTAAKTSAPAPALPHA